MQRLIFVDLVVKAEFVKPAPILTINLIAGKTFHPRYLTLGQLFQTNSYIESILNLHGMIIACHIKSNVSAFEVRTLKDLYKVTNDRSD